jgi:thiol-disulfide isomerase/thioredoxin
MIKVAIGALFILLVSFTFSQKEIQVKVGGEIFNMQGDSIKISQFMGNRYVDYLRGKIDKKGKFELSGKLPVMDYYVIRISNTQHLNIILRDKADIKVYGDAKNITAYNNIIGSEESSKLNEFILQSELYNRQKDSANTYLRQRPDLKESINQSFQPVYQNFFSYKQRFISENTNSPGMIATLNALDIETEFALYESVVNQLVAGFSGAPTIAQVKANFDQQKAQKMEMDFLAPGKMAPDFEQQLVDGTMMKLSDLKGKVVLLDFWASWCGPCRQENPNVVKLYEKYQKDGFTVLSVSLDKSREPWLAAIEKDKLVWPYHVSDLKFWQNQAAKLYKVSGIPFTVLIDREGKIIETKLRGPQLEGRLMSIFGY